MPWPERMQQEHGGAHCDPLQPTPYAAHAERRTRQVVVLTAAMMAIEIVAGTLSGSMALLADGWHMATHVAAFGITLFAYRYARHHARSGRYSFGTGKVGVLGGFTSAVALAMVALAMAVESVGRLFEPQAIRFDEAIAVAIAGLLVNLVSGVLLHGAQHDHPHATDTHHHHHDHNLRAAYYHVLADALTSVFAIVALAAGKYLDWIWLDAVVGIIGAAVIARWAWGLLRDTGHILLDGQADAATLEAVRRAIEADADNRISDLHVWQLAPGRCALALSLTTRQPRPPDHYKALLGDIGALAHVTVEVVPREDASRAPAP